MKQIESQQICITSNEYVNKLLLVNPDLDTRFEYSVFAAVEFAYILYDLYKNQKLSRHDLDLIYEHLHVQARLFDFSSIVKDALILQEYYLDKFKNDPDPYIRQQLAGYGHFLDEFTYDESDEVRETVAKRGHNLHILKKDKSKSVRNAAILCERTLQLKASRKSDNSSHNHNSTKLRYKHDNQTSH